MATASLPMCVREVQQEFADLCGIENRAIWDLYDANSVEALRTKIELTFPKLEIDTTHIASIRQDPKSKLTEEDKAKKEKKYVEQIEKEDKKMVLTEKDKAKKEKKYVEQIEKENKKMEEIRDILRTAIWAQRKYYGGKLLMSILYVLRTEEKEVLDDAQVDTKLSIHPLFRIRKCINNEASIDCCMVFIDECGRVYQNWSDYKENNHLPEGTLVAPHKGVYRNQDGNVMLECFISPASKAGRKVLNATDKGASVLGIAASVAPIASLFTPIGPIVLGASIITGAAVGAWSVGRSIGNLVDRGQHEQSINVTDREARSSWLGIGAGVTCLAASGATSALARSSAAGRDVSKVALGAVNTLNVTSTMINGVTLVNGAIEMILKTRDGDEITWADCLQMSASLFLFTHSVYNFQTASQIVQTSRDNSIKGFRDGLSKRQRKIFDKMARATISSKGAEQGKIDIIRSLRNIPDKKMYFSDVKRSLKDLNKNNIKPSFSPDGTVLLNNDHAVSSNILRINIKETPQVILSKIMSAPVEQTQQSIDLVNQLKKNPIQSVSLIKRTVDIIRDFSVQSQSNLLSFLAQIYSTLTQEAGDKLVSIAKLFLTTFGRIIQDRLGRNLPYEEVLYQAYDIVSKAATCVKFISRFIMETSELDLQNLIFEHYDHLIEIVQDRLFLICSEFSISNLDDLKNCLLNLFETLTEAAANKILQIAESIFTYEELEMIKSIKNFIEFDQFLYDVYRITLGLAGVDDRSEVTSANVLALQDSDIERDVTKYYEHFSASLGKKEKCGKCSGWYFLNE